MTYSEVSCSMYDGDSGGLQIENKLVTRITSNGLYHAVNVISIKYVITFYSL